jgi:hypothetical protein
LKREEVTRDRESCIIRSFTSLSALFTDVIMMIKPRRGEMGLACNMHKK